MENVKKQLQENQMFRNMFIAFVTFFLMIVAIMTNSIVSATGAYAITNPNDKKTYSYDYCYTYISTYPSKGIVEKRIILFNKPLGYEERSGNIYFKFNEKGNSASSKDTYFYYLQQFTNGELTMEHYGDFGSSYSFVVGSHSEDMVISEQHTNSTFIKNLSVELGFTGVKVDNPPLLTPDKVKGIAPAIKETLQVIIPVGLVIFGAILGIYLIKRLVALFL